MIDSPRIAALLFRRVGDSLLATPALRAVKLRYPMSKVFVLCEPQVQRIFQGLSFIDEIMLIEPAANFMKLGTLVRRRKADIVLDFLSDSRSATACRISGVQTRIGIERKGRSWLYTTTIPRQNESEPVYSAVHKMLLAEAVGAKPLNREIEFALFPRDLDFAASEWQLRGWNDQSRIAAFFVHSRREYKRWPLSHYAELIRRLMAAGTVFPLILSTPGDEDSISELRHFCPVDDCHIITLGDLGYLGAVLKRCSVYIGNDGGPKHIACAVRTPTVTIFTHDSSAYWTPPGNNLHLALNGRLSANDVWPLILDHLQTTQHDR